MTKYLSICIIALFLLASCGPSAQEIAAQERARMEMKEAVEIQLQKCAEDIDKNKELLKQNRASLAGAQAKMNSIQEFHFLRTASEKANQIEAQTLVILSIEENIQTLESNIQILTENKQQLSNRLAAL